MASVAAEGASDSEGARKKVKRSDGPDHTKRENFQYIFFCVVWASFLRRFDRFGRLLGSGVLFGRLGRLFPAGGSFSVRLLGAVWVASWSA